MMEVTVLIADIIESKKIEERKEFQDSLKTCLDGINQNSQYIISPYTITLGDEFQAIYEYKANPIEDILNILLNSYPVKIRFSFGLGTITTAINHENSLGMDGPAFHVARKGLIAMKNIDYSHIQLFGEDSHNVEFINKTLMISMSVMSDWKRNTLMIFNELLNHNTVNDMLPLLDISKRSIYKSIKTNKLREYVEYFSCLMNKLDE